MTQSVIDYSVHHLDIWSVVIKVAKKINFQCSTGTFTNNDPQTFWTFLLQTSFYQSVAANYSSLGRTLLTTRTWVTVSFYKTYYCWMEFFWCFEFLKPKESAAFIFTAQQIQTIWMDSSHSGQEEKNVLPLRVNSPLHSCKCCQF